MTEMRSASRSRPDLPAFRSGCLLTCVSTEHGTENTEVHVCCRVSCVGYHRRTERPREGTMTTGPGAERVVLTSRESRHATRRAVRCGR